MEETKIIQLNSVERRLRKIREQARDCLSDRVEVYDPSKNLSEQVYEDSPILYLNPTEKMHISNLVVPGSTFLTVLGSGDFVVDAAFNGARKVVTFDINKNQYYPAALKLKGLQNMNYEEFFDFFSNVNSSKYLSKEVYDELKNKAEYDNLLYEFFDEIIEQREKDRNYQQNILKQIGSGNGLLQKAFAVSGISLENTNEVELDAILDSMIVDYSGSSVFRTINGAAGLKTKGTYLENEESYNIAQEKIKTTDISHINANINEIKTTLDSLGYTKKHDYSKFDSIYLSNIPEYIDGETFAHTVEDQLLPLLTENGVIAYCCQATTKDTLNKSTEEINKMKKNAGYVNDNMRNPFSVYQAINAAEGINLLNKKYDISFEEETGIAAANGLEEKDTYVYIKKNNKRR